MNVSACIPLCVLFSSCSVPVSATSTPAAPPRPFSSQHDLYLAPDKNSLSLKHVHRLIFQTSQRSEPVSSLLCRAPEEADSCSSSQWDICISGLYFIRSIFPSERRGTLMSLKSHYGWGSAPAKTDFLWFCSGGEEMRESKSLWSKIQMDMAGHEGNSLKCTAPSASFHHGGVPCLAVISVTQCESEM